MGCTRAFPRGESSFGWQLPRSGVRAFLAGLILGLVLPTSGHADAGIPSLRRLHRQDRTPQQTASRRRSLR
jgi:hypothetical protein